MVSQRTVRRGQHAARDREAPRKQVLVKPVVSSIRILRYLCDARHPATLTQIARELELNPSTCLSILRTLVALGFAVPFGNTKTYVIGDGIIELAEGVLGRGGILKSLNHSMQRLARRYSVTVTLWRQIEDERLELIASAVSGADVEIQMRLGQRLPRWISAVGRVMAAHSGLSEVELKRRFKGLRWQSAPSFRTYMEEVNAVKQRGYAIDNGNYARGVLTISAPIFNPGGDVTCACSVTMFAGQHSPATLDQIAKDLLTIGDLLRRGPQTHHGSRAG